MPGSAVRCGNFLKNISLLYPLKTDNPFLGLLPPYFTGHGLCKPTPLVRVWGSGLHLSRIFKNDLLVGLYCEKRQGGHFGGEGGSLSATDTATVIDL